MPENPVNHTQAMMRTVETEAWNQSGEQSVHFRVFCQTTNDKLLKSLRQKKKKKKANKREA